MVTRGLEDCPICYASRRKIFYYEMRTEPFPSNHHKSSWEIDANSFWSDSIRPLLILVGRYIRKIFIYTFILYQLFILFHACFLIELTYKLPVKCLNEA